MTSTARCVSPVDGSVGAEHVLAGEKAIDQAFATARQVLAGVNHHLVVMMDEPFDPVVGLMRVRDDDEAIGLMNHSPFGLTAAVWTKDEDAAIAIGDRIETGTFFMNRCDDLDLALAWTGIKHSGRGCALPKVGYDTASRPKSNHLRTNTN